jgi:hypothetical protein
MDMENAIEKYIAMQPAARQGILKDIHAIITDNDATVTAVIDKMMGKEMIIYKEKSMMKYALASVKNYMSLHVLPMYMSKTIFSKYQNLLPQASFQKGCINFESAEAMPLDEVARLIKDCSTVDLSKIREKYQKTPKQKAK